MLYFGQKKQIDFETCFFRLLFYLFFFRIGKLRCSGRSISLTSCSTSTSHASMSVYVAQLFCSHLVTLRREARKNNFLTENNLRFYFDNFVGEFPFHIYISRGEMEQSVENLEHIYVHTAIIKYSKCDK